MFGRFVPVFCLAALALPIAAMVYPAVSLDDAAWKDGWSVPGALPCSAARGTRTSLTLSSVYVGNDKLPCTTWEAPFPNTTARSGIALVSGAKLPFVAYLAHGGEAHGRSRRIFLRIVGGPGGSVAPTVYDRVFVGAMRPGDLLVSLGYTGTSYGTAYPDPDFQTAVKEVSEYMRMALASGEYAEVVLTGESLGGQIAAAAMQEMASPKHIRLILINPMALSPEQEERNFTITLRHSSSTDTKYEVRRVSAPGQPAGGGAWTSVPSIDLFSHFFDAASRNVTLEERLSAKPVPTLLLYGSEDKVMGTIDVPELAKLPSLRVQRIAGMSHVLDEQHLPLLITTIKGFLDAQGE